MSEEIYFKNTFLSMKQKLYRFAFYYLKEAQTAEDALQDAMMKIWDKRGEWSEIKNEEAWSMTVVKNICLDRLRKEATHRKHENQMIVVDRDEQDPNRISVWQDQWSLLHKVIKQLNENQRMVFKLRDIEGYSYKEIAVILSLSDAQVKTELFRARKILKACMHKINDYGTTRNQSIA
ncbi:MAG: RNA polymerase sigma-70 factor (ECF subfamily) [Marivirga sp.]|jgi:RNA polymerase sigma-70 factor (ECF subfamily)